MRALAVELWAIGSARLVHTIQQNHDLSKLAHQINQYWANEPEHWGKTASSIKLPRRERTPNLFMDHLTPKDKSAGFPQPKRLPELPKDFN